MDKERNAHQIVRKDGKGWFVESLNDAFSIGRCHLAFAAYDLNRPAGADLSGLRRAVGTVPEGGVRRAAYAAPG